MQRFIFFVLILVILSACGPRPMPLVAEQVALPTRAITATPTQLPTKQPTETPRPTDTPTTTPTRQPTATQTPFPTATATATVAAAATFDATRAAETRPYSLEPARPSSDAVWRQPSNDELVWLQLKTIEDTDEPIFHSMLFWRLFEHVMATADWENYHSDLNWLTQTRFSARTVSQLPTQQMRPLVEAQLLDVIYSPYRTVSSPAIEKLENVIVQRERAQLDDDPEWEWWYFVHTHSRYGRLLGSLVGILPVDVDESSQTSVIPNDIMAYRFPEPWISSFHTAFDLLGDGRSELLVQRTTQTTAVLDVYTPTASGIEHVISIPLVQGRNFTLSHVEIADVTGDGQLDIQITENRGARPNCRYQTGMLVDFSTTVPVTTTIDTSDESADCLVSAALDWLHIPARTLDSEIALLEQALVQLQPTTPVDHYKLPFVYLQLATRYQAKGDVAAATAAMAQIAGLADANSYAALLTERRAASADFFTFCHDLNQEIYSLYRWDPTDDARFADQIPELLYQQLQIGNNREDITAPRMARMLCDVDKLIQERLVQLTASTELSAAEAIATTGLAVQYGEALNLDADPTLEWAGYVGTAQRPLFVMLDQRNSQWHLIQPHQVTWFDEHVFPLFREIDSGFSLHVAQRPFGDDDSVKTLLNLYAPFYSKHKRLHCANNGVLLLDSVTLEPLDYEQLDSECVPNANALAPVDLVELTPLMLDRAYNTGWRSNESSSDLARLETLLSHFAVGEISAETLADFEALMATKQFEWTDERIVVYAYALEQLGRTAEAATQYMHLSRHADDDVIVRWARLHLDSSKK